jgi:hypothetical protein
LRMLPILRYYPGHADTHSQATAPHRQNIVWAESRHRHEFEIRYLQSLELADKTYLQNGSGSLRSAYDALFTLGTRISIREYKQVNGRMVPIYHAPLQGKILPKINKNKDFSAFENLKFGERGATSALPKGAQDNEDRLRAWVNDVSANAGHPDKQEIAIPSEGVARALPVESGSNSLRSINQDNSAQVPRVERKRFAEVIPIGDPTLAAADAGPMAAMDGDSPSKREMQQMLRKKTSAERLFNDIDAMLPQVYEKTNRSLNDSMESSPAKNTTGPGPDRLIDVDLEDAEPMPVIAIECPGKGRPSASLFQIADLPIAKSYWELPSGLAPNEPTATEHGLLIDLMIPSSKKADSTSLADLRVHSEIFSEASVSNSTRVLSPSNNISNYGLGKALESGECGKIGDLPSADGLLLDLTPRNGHPNHSYYLDLEGLNITESRLDLPDPMTGPSSSSNLPNSTVLAANSADSLLDGPVECNELFPAMVPSSIPAAPVCRQLLPGSAVPHTGAQRIATDTAQSILDSPVPFIVYSRPALQASNNDDLLLGQGVPIDNILAFGIQGVDESASRQFHQTMSQQKPSLGWKESWNANRLKTTKKAFGGPVRREDPSGRDAPRRNIQAPPRHGIGYQATANAVLSGQQGWIPTSEEEAKKRATEKLGTWLETSYEAKMPDPQKPKPGFHVASSGSPLTNLTNQPPPAAAGQREPAQPGPPQFRSAIDHDIEDSMRKLLEKARFCAGAVRLETHLGRMCIVGVPKEMICTNPNGPSFTMENLLPRLDEMKGMTFQKTISSFGVDVELLAESSWTGMPGWKLESVKVYYDIFCAKYQDPTCPFVIQVDADDFTYTLRDQDDQIGCINIHCAGRPWDARVSLTVTRPDLLEERYGSYAKGVVDSLAIE